MSENDSTDSPPAVALHSDEITLFEYTSEGLVVPATATHIKITTPTIPSRAFRAHETVRSIEIAQGVKSIEATAFSRCFALKYAKIPPSIECMGPGTFGCDNCLLEVSLPDTLKQIPQGCFAFCVSFRSFRVPSRVITIGHRAFWGCRRLVSIEIPIGVERIEGQAFLECSELFNIALPPTAEIGPGAFDECTQLSKHLPDDREKFEAALKNRFEDLPIHKLCYYQSYHSLLDFVESMRTLIRSRKSCNSLFDDFQMSPLHLLVLSAKPKFELCKIFSSHPGALRYRDKTGATPMACSMINFAPGIVPIIKHLSRKLYAAHCDCLGLERWKEEIETALESLDPSDDVLQRGPKIQRYLKAVSKNYTKEVLSSLELGVWKSRLDQTSRAIVRENDRGGLATVERPKKKPRLTIDQDTGITTDGRIDRQLCRTLCMSDVIVESVLPFISNFLIKEKSEDIIENRIIVDASSRKL